MIRSIATAVLAFSICGYPIVEAAPTGRTYENVPTITVRSDRFSMLEGRSTLEAHLGKCRERLMEAQRLLSQKGVDIVLESTSCSLVLFGDNHAQFSAQIFFLN